LSECGWKGADGLALEVPAQPQQRKLALLAAPLRPRTAPLPLRGAAQRRGGEVELSVEEEAPQRGVGAAYY